MKAAESADVLKVAEDALSRYPLCDRCLGRLFAGLGHGLSNAERGRALKLAILMRLAKRVVEGDSEAASRLESLAPNMGPIAVGTVRALLGRDVEPRPCYVCGGIIDDFIARAVDAVAEGLRKYNVHRFLVGVHVDRSLTSREEEVKATVGAKYSESIARELKREIGKGVQASYGLVVDFDRPEAVALVSFPDGNVDVQVRRVTVAGAYRRYSRVNPIKPYMTHPLVEAVLKIMEAEGASILGLVRDEGGFRVLGAGVPVVVSVARARSREALKPGDRISAGGAELLVMGIGVPEPLEESLARRIRIYRCVVTFDRQVGDSELQSAVDALRGKEIEQMVRSRKVKGLVRDISCTSLTPWVAECLVELDERLYVIELMNGHGTVPSLSSALGAEVECATADLLGVLEV